MSNKVKLKDKDGKVNKSRTKKTVKSIEIPEEKKRVKNKLTLFDYISMIVLTTIFAFLVFYKIGSKEAPVTSKEMNVVTAEKELIIDFGDYISVANMDIFLGNLEKRGIAISAYNEVTKEWEVINGDLEITSVFCWNRIPVNMYLRYLGIVFTNDQAVINEIVFLSPEGEVLTPVNASDYPELFDEQAKYPKYSSYYTGTMFDEIYHGRTAFEFIHGYKTYETTHPHFGKLLISLGIRMFGMTPFGWRFMVAIFGILMVPVMYIFAKRVTKNSYIALITDILLTFDCMHFGLSRIATIDIIIGLFILVMYYFMYSYLEQNDKETKYAYFLLIMSGIFLGFAISTKFTGIYAAVGLAVLLISYLIMNFPEKTWKKMLVVCISFFIVIPLAMYVLSFIPVVETTKSSNLITKAINGTKYMVDYHSNLNATHYYSSPWYSWPIVGKPVLYAHEVVENGKISTVSIMGNPAVWWVIIPSVLYLIYRAFKLKDKTASFLCISYFTQYLPWMLVSRCIFIYHYFPCVLFGILCIGYSAKCIFKDNRKNKIILGAYALVVIVIFLVLFPAISGVPASVKYLQGLKWLPDWVITY